MTLSTETKRRDEADKIRQIESDLWSAFEWRTSPQGHDYWSEVAANQVEIADRTEAGTL